MPSPSTSPLAPGDRVGPYEIRGFLGQGGMGRVYQGFDPRLERTVALKVIVVPEHASEADSQRVAGEFAARLLREARAVASLSHPNVVGIYDVGEDAGRLYLAMEYVVGATLRTLMTSDRELPLSERVRWLVGIARALDAAHHVGLVHRDVKPENVMIREDGTVKVLDFGIARRTVPTNGGDQRAIDTVTGAGAIAGTPVYMAPEQIRGSEVDARCDQFGWAVTAYELVTGRRPWPDNGDVLALVAKILTEPPMPLRSGDERSGDENVPSVLEDTILRALAKDPGARFPTMNHVADALEPLATREAGRATDAHERVRIVPPTSEDVAAYAATTRVPTNLPIPPADAGNDKKRRRRWLFPTVALLLAGTLGTGLAAGFFAGKGRDTGTVAPARKLAQPRPLSIVPEADKSFKDAMRLWHDGAAAKARAALDRAVQLDPTFAAAQLELAIQTQEEDPAAAQAAFQSAFENRAMLLPRDAALLEASEPYVRAKPDLDEWETRMTSMVFQYPRDPELQLLLGRARERRGDDANAKLAYEAATKIDANFVPATVALVGVQRHLDHAEDALATADRCIQTSPVASMCVAARYGALEDLGRCHDAREDAANWRTLEPTSPKALVALGFALYADGAPRPSVEEVLAQSWPLLDAPDRALAEIRDRLWLALDAGELDRALELARTYEEKLPTTADQLAHAFAARTMVRIFLEQDDAEDATKTARSFLDRRDAWPVYPFAIDPSIEFHAMLYRAEQITPDELATLRQRWLEREKARLPTSVRPESKETWNTWASVWGAFVETRDEAVAALSHVPSAHVPSAALPAGSRRTTELDFVLGRTYALANRPAEALPLLLRVTQSCSALDDVLLVQRARWFAGNAYEASGDTNKARDMYRKIVAAWPGAPGSRTVKSANERLEALSHP